MFRAVLNSELQANSTVVRHSESSFFLRRGCPKESAVESGWFCLPHVVGWFKNSTVGNHWWCGSSLVATDPLVSNLETIKQQNMIEPYWAHAYTACSMCWTTWWSHDTNTSLGRTIASMEFSIPPINKAKIDHDPLVGDSRPSLKTSFFLPIIASSNVRRNLLRSRHRTARSLAEPRHGEPSALRRRVALHAELLRAVPTSRGSQKREP